VASKHGAISEFFLLARLAQSKENASTSFLIEGLMQAFLNVVVKSTKAGGYLYFPAVTSFIGEMRGAVSSGLPDFSSVGLNSAWCLRQGDPNRSTNTGGCKNPNCMKPFSEGGIFCGSGKDRRCIRCYQYTNLNKTKAERPLKAVMKCRDRDRTQAANAAGEGCKNKVPIS
jgi:hypothetical protein